MDDEGQQWRNRYLANLERQEELERKWQARTDLLCRGLVCSSLAAEGSDSSVDQCMQDLRKLLRRDDVDEGISALIPRLEKTVLASEQHRQQRIDQVADGITTLLTQLLRLDLPREIRKPLKKFSKKLDSRVKQSRELPALLAELGQLQQQTLTSMASPAPERLRLMQRLFGRTQDRLETTAQPIAASSDAIQRENVQSSETATDLAGTPARFEQLAQEQTHHSTRPAPPAASAASTEQLSETVSAERDAPVAPAATSPVSQTESEAFQVNEPAAQDAEYALPVSPEPSYSSIAKHLESILLDLLDELPLPQQYHPQGEQLRQRITDGLNLYELVTVLDDFAVLMLAVANASQRDFEGYLQELNERLVTFQSGLHDVHSNYADSTQAVHNLNTEIRSQVDGLHSSMQDAIDLPGLKEAVAQRLNGLLDTMEEYQRQREERDQQVSERLQVLVERVAGMEEEAKSYRDHLEEQRQKALIDPLTGLPNRAALDERQELEAARKQRYGGELLLAILDIDHFKRVNDDFGHLAGDKVLKIIAMELSKRLRKTDFVARYGGEEFVLLLPSTPLSGGLELLEALRLAVQDCPFHFKGERVVISLSGGVACFADNETSEQVFERADQALYRAKRAGRNRIEQG